MTLPWHSVLHNTRTYVSRPRETQAWREREREQDCLHRPTQKIDPCWQPQEERKKKCAWSVRSGEEWSGVELSRRSEVTWQCYYTHRHPPPPPPCPPPPHTFSTFHAYVVYTLRFSTCTHTSSSSYLDTPCTSNPSSGKPAVYTFYSHVHTP